MFTIKHSLLGIAILCSFTLKSQVGVNTQTPDNSAALDIQPSSVQPNSGLLIPRLNQGQRVAIPNPAKGLMVFDLTDNLFYVNLNAGSHNWYAINPWQTKATTGTVSAMYTHSTVTNVGIGTTNPTVRLDVNGSITSNSVVSTQTLAATTVTVPGFAANALVPTGLISMFSGTLIPTGWGLCDGSIQGGIQTPDLRGRFIIGFDTYSPPPLDIATSRAVAVPAPGASATPVVAPNDGVTKNYGQMGNTGGETGHALLSTESGLPAHTHTYEDNYIDHDGINCADGGGNGWAFNRGNNPHVRPSDPNSAQNAANVHENRPPYYVLAYIIKLP